MGRSDDIISGHQEYLFPCVNVYYDDPVVITRGKMGKVYDAEGREYLDFFGGILTISVGHCNPEITDRVIAQMQELQHSSTLYPTEPQVRLAKRLADITPGSLKKSFFTNSGTEANETAILLAQMYTGATDVIVLRHAYHGRSALTMSLAGVSPWRVQRVPLGGISHAHTAYCYRCALGRSYPDCGLACASDVEELIQTATSGRVAAVIAEPIQGVGGYITPPPGYFEELVRIVRSHGGLFICDEVQTGFGRTGKMFGIQHWNVEPDIMTFAKGLANGVPIGVTIARDEIASAFEGQSISTFGGNPVSATAALATLDYIEEKGLVENARVQGERMRNHLLELRKKCPAIRDVRGAGLMQAVEFASEDGTPMADETARMFEETRRQGLLVGRGGLYKNCLRIAPPLNVSAKDIDASMQILGDSLSALQA
jgi:4-aminobutyrate aminotransferase-like enzyme